MSWSPLDNEMYDARIVIFTVILHCPLCGAEIRLTDPAEWEDFECPAVGCRATFVYNQRPQPDISWNDH